MERYKAFIMYTISNDHTRTALEELLMKNCFERLHDQSTYGLSLDEYRVKVQPVKAEIKQFCQASFEEGDTAFFFESRMNEERTLSAIIQSDLMKDE